MNSDVSANINVLSQVVEVLLLIVVLIINETLARLVVMYLISRVRFVYAALFINW